MAVAGEKYGNYRGIVSLEAMELTLGNRLGVHYLGIVGQYRQALEKHLSVRSCNENIAETGRRPFRVQADRAPCVLLIVVFKVLLSIDVTLMMRAANSHEHCVPMILHQLTGALL